MLEMSYIFITLNICVALRIRIILVGSSFIKKDWETLEKIGASVYTLCYGLKFESKMCEMGQGAGLKMEYSLGLRQLMMSRFSFFI